MCLKVLDNWFKANKLTLNLEKKHHMWYFPPEEYSALKCYSTMLTLTRFILANILAVFYKLRSKISSEQLRNIYFSFVYSLQ